MTDTATEGSATGQAREKAQEVGGQAKDKAQEAGTQAKDKAQEVGVQAKEKAQEAGAQARSRVSDEVDRRSTEAGEQAGSTAQALRDVSGKLREEGNEPVARGLEQVADRVERAGGWLRDSDGDSILSDVEDFGRRNTLAVVAGGLALGFAASRLLKASSRSRYQSGGSRLPATTGDGSDNGARATTGATVGVGAAPPDPGLTPSTPAPPREGLTESGLSGGTPATSPPAWAGGEGEGALRPGPRTTHRPTSCASARSAISSSSSRARRRRWFARSSTWPRPS